MSVVGCLLVLATNAAWSQRVSKDSWRLTEMVTIKTKAEAGDLNSQIKLGKAFADRLRFAEALSWYRKAAGSGSVDGCWLAGEFLLFGKPSKDASQQVIAAPAEGLRFSYIAATNSHRAACRNLAIAMQRGLGGRTNMAEGYAWLRLYAEADPERRQRELDTMALSMSPDELARAVRVFQAMKRGVWPACQGSGSGEYRRDVRFKLTAIFVAQNRARAVVNGRTVAEGESALIPVTDGVADVKCLKIEENAVLLSLADGGGTIRVSFN